MLATLTAAQINIRILLALGVLVVASRLAGWSISKIGQPQVHGEILAGILLGPSLLGVIWPGAMSYLFPTEIIGALKVLAQVGLVLFMFLIGLQLNLDHLRGQGHKAVVISQSSIVTPILVGAALATWLYPRLGAGVGRLGFTLFIGAAMSITAFPVLARVLQETGLHRTRIGALTMTCAAVDDVTAWCMLAIVVAVVRSSGPAQAIRTVLLSVAYFAVVLFLVRPLLARIRSIPLWVTICLALLSAWITEQIGIHAIFGAFLIGAAMPRRPEFQRNITERLEHATLAFLLPVFFVVVGLSTRIDLLTSPYLIGVTALVVATAIVGKWGGAMIAAKATGESWQDAAAIGVLMNTRGLTELVILSVGLELGVITPTVFTMMVIMALVTTLMATPILSLISPLYHRGMRDEEVAGEMARASANGDGHVSTDGDAYADVVDVEAGSVRRPSGARPSSSP
jgi:Kef-type K+ transport system membrane component KefB